jgi:hypothetical protein
LPKNKVEQSGVFFEAEKVASTPHVSPPNHHNITSKKPHKNTHFPKTPTKKAGKSA